MLMWSGAALGTVVGGVASGLEHRPLGVIVALIGLFLLVFVVRPEDLS